MQYYVIRAKLKLKNYHNLKVIAITGSYGKTSCKFILTQMLKEKYVTLCTPGSYNTLMGICKSVLSDLKPQHEIFIVEMGADHINDIKKLCKFIKPDISVLTSIGPQHLETFKTIDNIIKTKYQIMEGLKVGGLGVFNCDNEYVLPLYERFNGNKLGISNNLGYYATAGEVSVLGQNFSLVTPNDNYDIQTKLLGNHQSQNVLLCTAICEHLNITKEQIIHSMRIIKPIKNRLELVLLPSGDYVLDDSFNSNPKGSIEALNVLARFNDFEKIVITPGMVELKEKAYWQNFAFAKQMAKVANKVYIVNQINKEVLVNGLRAGGFEWNNIFYFDRFEDAFKTIQQKVLTKHIILIENDLPDQYL